MTELSRIRLTKSLKRISWIVRVSNLSFWIQSRYICVSKYKYLWSKTLLCKIMFQHKIWYSFYISMGKQIQRWLTWSYNNVGHIYLICRVWHQLLNVFWNFMKKVLSLSFNRTYCHNFLTLCFLIFYLFIFNGLVIFFLTFSSLFRPCAYTTI